MSNQEKILSLQNLYQIMERKIQIFKEKTHLDCVPGCGDCCNRFEPYISVLEGMLIADWLLKNPEELKNFFYKLSHKSEILCPFYQINPLYHCGIYSIRPFICRLFAFSGKRKGKEIEYSPCLRMQNHYIAEIKMANHYLSEGLELPIYTEEYGKICQIDFLLATDLHPLTRSIEIALEEFSPQKSNKPKKITQSIHFSTIVRKTLEKIAP